MRQQTAKKLLDLMGWEVIGEKCSEKNVVILEAPHTSMRDFVIGYLFYRAVGGHLKIMVKDNLFFWPLGPVIRSMGGFPINRTSPAKAIINVVHAMEANKDGEFHMVLCPEGTRKAVAKWKTGYHTIATRANVPVYLSMVDWGRKRTGIFQKFQLSDDARKDTDAIQAIYEAMGVEGYHKDRFLTR